MHSIPTCVLVEYRPTLRSGLRHLSADSRSDSDALTLRLLLLWFRQPPFATILLSSPFLLSTISVHTSPSSCSTTLYKRQTHTKRLALCPHGLLSDTFGQQCTLDLVSVFFCPHGRHIRRIIYIYLSRHLLVPSYNVRSVGPQTDPSQSLNPTGKPNSSSQHKHSLYSRTHAKTDPSRSLNPTVLAWKSGVSTSARWRVFTLRHC